MQVQSECSCTRTRTHVSAIELALALASLSASASAIALNAVSAANTDFGGKIRNQGQKGLVLAPKIANFNWTL